MSGNGEGTPCLNVHDPTTWVVVATILISTLVPVILYIFVKPCLKNRAQHCARCQSFATATAVPLSPASVTPIPSPAHHIVLTLDGSIVSGDFNGSGGHPTPPTRALTPFPVNRDLEDAAMDGAAAPYGYDDDNSPESVQSTMSNSDRESLPSPPGQVGTDVPVIQATVEGIAGAVEPM